METAFTGDRYDNTGEIMIIGGVACGAGSIPFQEWVGAIRNTIHMLLA